MKLYKKLEEVLKKEQNHVTDEGELKKWVIISKAQNYDPGLIAALLADGELKEKFFISVEGALIFNQSLFVQFLEQKNYLNDSYTEYSNKVGLNIDGKFLNQRNEISLVWPYKDCILEGGQSKEEDTREEVFFNQVLAQDEINQLLEQKVLTNGKRYTSKGEKALDQFNRNNKGDITDNLVIKGNNLLALHSIKKEFGGRVKLIYIDPPFNTGKDEFKYNDSFNHSTWLTFMKNRLEVAKTLLNKDGVIVVHVGNEEAAYVQVLLDEIFKRENFLNHITMTTNAPSGFKATSAKIFSTANHLYIYSRETGADCLNKLYLEKDFDKNYKYYLLNPDEKFSKWKFTTSIEVVAENEGFSNVSLFKKEFSAAAIFEKLKIFSELNKERVFRTAAIGGGALKKRKSTVDKSNKQKGIVLQHPDEDVEGFYILNGEQIVFWSNTYKDVDGKMVPTTALTDVWTDIGFTGIANEGNVTLKNGKKPEKLLKRIIELTTNKNDDIVLDYHSGSGTTAAVAHKMGRQYICIEQLDYGTNDDVVRLKNVIDGEKTGISSLINWEGGGEFVYLELKKYNQSFIEQIENAKNTKALISIWEEMKKKSFLNYNVDLKKQEAYIDELKALPLPHQKHHLIVLLDKNQLYVNLSSLNDKDFQISESEKTTTRAFYQLKSN